MPTVRIRILLSLVVIVAILGGLAAATPYLINTRVVKKQISKQISDWMGLPVSVRGEPVVTVFPYITVKLKDVQVSSNLGPDQPPLVSMEILRAEMYWLPLILGRFEVRRFHLSKPEFELVRNKDGKASWDMTRGSLVSSNSDGRGFALSDISLGTFRISEGKAHYIDHRKGQDEHFDEVNLSFDWPSTGKTAAVNGGFLWRGETMQANAQSDKPMELFDGGLSPLSLKVSSPLFSAQLDGTAATMASFQFEGDFEFETPSVRKLLTWQDVTLRPGDNLGAASLSARSNIVGASVSFSDLSMMLDENHVDGVLQLDFRRDRALVQGTLAGDALDLSSYLAPSDGTETILDENLNALELGKADLDVRLSVNKMTVGPVQLGRTAATLVTRDKQISFSIGEAFAYGGRVEASLDMRPSKDNSELMNGHFRAKANGVLAGTLAKEFAKTEILSGTALAELDLQGEGDTIRQILQAAQGDVSLVLTDGTLNNFNLDIMQDVLETEAEAEPDALYEGGSGFDVLSIRGRMVNEVLNIDGLRVTSKNRALLGTAELNVSEMVLDFPGTLALYRSADPASHSSENPIKEYPFQLTGPLGQPQLLARNKRDTPVPEDKDILAPGVPKDVGPDSGSQDVGSPPVPETTADAGANDAEAANAESSGAQPDAQKDLKAQVPETPEAEAESSTLKALGDAAKELLQFNSNPKQGIAPAQ